MSIQQPCKPIAAALVSDFLSRHQRLHCALRNMLDSVVALAYPCTKLQCFRSGGDVQQVIVTSYWNCSERLFVPFWIRKTRLLNKATQRHAPAMQPIFQAVKQVPVTSHSQHAKSLSTSRCHTLGRSERKPLKEASDKMSNQRIGRTRN